MIAERIQQQDNEFSTSNTKYYQFSAILEHVIDCFHTIVSDETNPYHPPLGWLTRRQPKPPNDELFLDLMDECSKKHPSSGAAAKAGQSQAVQLSSSVRTRLERCPQQLRREIATRTQNGCSPLFLACRNGLTRVIKYLLDVCDADIEQRGLFEAFEDHHVHNVSPIWVAAVSGQLDVVKLLIDRGANINSVSDTGSTPIRSVCFLCEDDDGINEFDNFSDEVLPFGGVAERDNDRGVYMRIVQLLVENGADIARPNNSGGTCLINSLHNRRLTAYMVDNGAEVDAVDNQSKTALHYAILQDRLEVAKLLLKAGSNPYLTTDSSDDALQLCCIGGHVNIFKHLIENYTYGPDRLSDAYKLLGSSILEIHYDLSQVRTYWTKSLEISAKLRIADEKTAEASTSHVSTSTASNSKTADLTSSTDKSRLTYTKRSPQVIKIRPGSDRGRDICDMRRYLAYGDAVEFTNMDELHRLSMDDFRIQSLLISERVLGPTHRETIQRLLYRGTFYINSLRPNRCLDLWIYALRLRLETDSIYHFESIFAAQAITKFFLDLFSQRQHHQVKFNDVYDVLSLLVSRLHECQQHKDIYDLLLSMIVNLLLVLRCSQRQHKDKQLISEITSALIGLDPRTSKGSSMLHLCVAPNMYEGEIHRSLLMAYEARSSNNADNINARRLDTSDDANSPVVGLIDELIGAGLDVDSINSEGLSALQTICLATGVNAMVKKKIIEVLVGNGAHVDRRALSAEQDERIKLALRESGVRLIDFVTLKCLAARRVSEVTPKLDKTCRVRLSRNLSELVAIH